MLVPPPTGCSHVATVVQFGVSVVSLAKQGLERMWRGLCDCRSTPADAVGASLSFSGATDGQFRVCSAAWCGVVIHAGSGVRCGVTRFGAVRCDSPGRARGAVRCGVMGHAGSGVSCGAVR